MVMKRRKIIVYVTLASFLVVSVAYLIFPPHLKLVYVLDSSHLARVEPQGNWSSMICPLCGSKLEQIVVDSDEPQTTDEAWRYAYYCKQEDLFWVINFPGGISSAQWYGPFNAYWKLANAVAISISIISGATIFLLAIRRKAISNEF
jgi:hypothetical protein